MDRTKLNTGNKLAIMKNHKNNTKYENALKHVKELKEFYQHFFIYITFVVVWLLFKEQIITFIIAKTENTDSGFMNWLNINVALVPVLWGIGVLIQGLYVYRLKFSIFKDWESRKIKEFMEEEENSKIKNGHWQ